MSIVWEFLSMYWAEMLLLLLPILKIIARFAGTENAMWFKIVRKIVRAITPDDTDVPKALKDHKKGKGEK